MMSLEQIEQMAEAVFGKCARCHGPGREVDLAGEYHAVLCRDCRNTYDSDCDAAQEWTRLCAAVDSARSYAALLKAGCKEILGDFLAAAKEERSAQTAMWLWSKKWILAPLTIDEQRKQESRKR